MGSIDWGAVWEFLWPILKEGIIAFLMALLALLGYDQLVPSRYMRRHPLEQAFPPGSIEAKPRKRAGSDARKVKE